MTSGCPRPEPGDVPERGTEARDPAPIYRELKRILQTDAATRDLADKDRTITLDHELSGILIELPYGDAPGRPRYMLIPDAPIPPLGKAHQPSAADLPDNHLAYAGQWFGLAITLSAIYGLWLRKRGVVAPLAKPE